MSKKVLHAAINGTVAAALTFAQAALSTAAVTGTIAVRSLVLGVCFSGVSWLAGFIIRQLGSDTP